MSYQKLSDFIDSQRDNMIKDIVDFVKIPSVSSNLKSVTESLHYFIGLAKDMGLDAKTVLDDRVGIVEVGDGDETIGILVHVDVVPAGDIALWDTPPFEPVIKDGCIFGRGTIDDKGPAISSLYSLKAILSLGKELKKKIQIIIGTQEEVEWTDMDDYVKAFPLPDYGFTPDGEFPLCNIEKGVGDIRIEVPLNQAKGYNYIKSINGGTAINAIPDYCEAIVAHSGREVCIRATGKTTHSSIPDNGINAITKLCDELSKMDIQEDSMFKAVKLISDKFTETDCRRIGLETQDEYYNGEYIHKNIISITMINCDDDKLTLCFNIRHTYGTTQQEIRDVFEKISDELGGKLSKFVIKPPVYISRQRPFINVFKDVYDELSGFKNEFTLAHGASYAKAMKDIVSWGPLFPGEVDTCHEANEFISINNLIKMTKIYAESLNRMAFTEQSFKK